MSSSLSNDIPVKGISVQDEWSCSSFSDNGPDRQGDDARGDDTADLYDSDSQDVTDAAQGDVVDAGCAEPPGSPNSGTWILPRPQPGFRDWMETESSRLPPDTSYQGTVQPPKAEELSLLGSKCLHRRRYRRKCSKRAKNRKPTTSASDSTCTDEDTRDAFDNFREDRPTDIQETCGQADAVIKRRPMTTASASASGSNDDEGTGKVSKSSTWNETKTASREDDDSNASDEDFNIAFIREPRNKYRARNGIPLIFKKLDNTAPAFSEVCLCCAEQHIAAATQEVPLSLEVTKKGFLRVSVETTTAASILQDMDNLGHLPVQVALPRGYSDNVAKIHNVPLVYTDAQIRKFFAPAGVVAAKRQVAYRTQPDGSIKIIPRDSVLLTFRPDREIPVRITPAVEYAEAFDYRYFTVRLHVTTPTQCFNCFRYGHMAKHCRRRVRCKVCAGDHSYKDCVSRVEQRCANCGGPHAATYGKCPARLAAVRDKKLALSYDRRPRDGNCY